MYLMHDMTEVHEISVDHNGYNFLVIYGRCKNGWFIAIPNWWISIISSDPNDYRYNSDKLAKQIRIGGAAAVIAREIGEDYRKRKEKI